jgi:hypothetical protein
MSEGYFMCFVKGVPKSTQIEWFVENYSKGIWKRADLRHIEIKKESIDSSKEYAGVYIREGDEYHYIFMHDTLDAFINLTEVFFPADDIAIGEL